MPSERRLSVFVTGAVCSFGSSIAFASEPIEEVPSAASTGDSAVVESAPAVEPATPPASSESPVVVQEAPAVQAAPAAAPVSDTDASVRKGRLTEILYFNVEAGAEYVSLQSLHLDEQLLPSTVRTAGIGPALGVGAGLRFVLITLGPRFRFANLPDYDLWSIGAELGLHVPLGPIEPWLRLGGGFAKVGRLQDQRVRISGYDVRLGLGLDYYLSKNWSLGVAGSAEVLGLTRPGVNLNEASGSLQEDILKLDGSSVGFAAMGGLVFGAHL